MSLRAPPGPLVGAGRVRVDAARAVAKLRAFRLADPAAWILEAIRAAVAGGASELELLADSDDLWLRWAGSAWSPDELASLLDELVSPEEEEHGYRRRLLGSAVNSALALAPRWLELVVAEAAGARGVRFTPEELEQAGRGGEPMLRAPQAVTGAALPALASGAPCAVQLHLCFAAGLRTWWRALRGQELPELALVRAACAELSVPITIGGARLDAPSDVLRLPLGQGLAGFVALAAPVPEGATQPEASLRVAELGVAITSVEWPEARLAAFPWLRGGAPPARLYLDAPRVVTNAARSAIDEAAPPFRTAKERGASLLGALVDALADRLSHSSALPLRDCAFALLAQVAGGGEWSVAGASLAPPLRAVAQVPLLRNAVGVLRPVAARWERPVYRGKRALPQELAPWLETLAWMPPGDPAARLLRGTDGHARAANELIQRARRARRARADFLAQPAVPARVSSLGVGVTFALGGARQASVVPDEVFAGLEGEVRVFLEGDVARLALLHHGRLLETSVLQAALSFDAILDSPGVTPDLRCRAAERDTAFERVERAARLGAVRAVEQWCLRDLADGAEPSGAPGAMLAALVRRTLAVVSAERLQLPSGTPLAQAKAWLTTEGQWLSLAELRLQRAVAVVDPRQVRVDPPPGRLVLRADRSVVTALAALAARTEIVSYGPFVALAARDPAAAAADRHAERGAAVTLLVREPHRAGAISPAPHGELALMHRGVVLRTEARAGVLLPCQVTVASEELVPGASWRTVLAGEEQATEGLERWERELANALLAALAGEEVADLRFLEPPRTRAAATEVLATALGALASAQLDELVGEERLATLLATPLFRVSTQPEPVSAKTLREWFAHGELLYTTPERASAFQGPCLVGELAEARLASWLTRLPLASASARGAANARAEHLLGRLVQHLTARAQDLALPAESFAVVLPAPWRGLLGASLDPRPRLAIEVWCQARPAFSLSLRWALPLLVAVELEPEAFDDSWTDLRPEVRAALVAALESGVERWLHTMLGEHPVLLIDSEPTRRVLVAWLERQELWPSRPEPELVRRLRAAPAWPTIQGGHASLQAAQYEGVVRTARWSEPWLPALDGAAHSLDAPVLALPSAASARESWRQIFSALELSTHEVSGAVVVMQAMRRAHRDGAARFAAALDEPTRQALFGNAAIEQRPGSGAAAVTISAGREALFLAGLLGGPLGPGAEPGVGPAEPGASPAEPGASLAEPGAGPAEPGAGPAEPMQAQHAAAGASAARPSAVPGAAHPLLGLVTAVAERLRLLCGRVLAFAHFVIVEDRVAPVVRVAGDRLELAGQAPELAQLAQLFARDAAEAEPGVVALLAYLASELNRAHTAVTDVHEQHILLELQRHAHRKEGGRAPAPAR